MPQTVSQRYILILSSHLHPPPPQSFEVEFLEVYVILLFLFKPISTGKNNLSAILGALQKATISFVISVCPSAWNNSATTRRILTKLDIWGFFSKTCVLYMTTSSHLWYLADFFLEWEMFYTKVVEKIRTHPLCSITVLRKSCRLWDNVEKCGENRGTTNDVTIWRIRVACWISKATCRHAHAHAHAPGRTHTRARAHTHMQQAIGFLPSLVIWSGTNVSGLPVFAIIRVSIWSKGCVPDDGTHSSPETLVPDQITTPGINPKTFIHQDNCGQSLQSYTCNIYCFSTATVVTWTRLSVTLYVYCLSCYNLFSQVQSTQHI